MTKVGEHITLDIIGTTKEYDPSIYEKVIQQIAKAAKVTILDISKYKFEPQGFTILALLAESHISFHTFPEKGIISFDFFTCGKVSPSIAIDIVKKEFKFLEIRGRLPQDTRCIYLLRNPIDTAVSYYYHRVYRDGLKYKETIDKFCIDNVDSIVDHHNAVLSTKWKNLCVIQYEKLKTDGLNELRKIFDFTDIEISDDEINNLISVGDFNKMKKYHADQKFQNKGYRLLPSNGKPEGAKVRKGIMYGYRDELKKETIEQLYTQCKQFNYKNEIKYFEGL